jgi:PAS domain-containing protein
MRFQKAENRTTLLYASEGARELYGLTMDELADDAGIIFRVCHPDDQLLLNEAIANAVREGGVLNVEHRICVPGKAVRWVHTEAAIERLADASIVWHGYIQDITGRKLSEAASTEIAQRHILAARAHGLGIWDCVMQTNTLTFDARTYEIYAATQDEFPNPWDLWKVRIHPDDKVRVAKETAELGTAARNDAELFITEFRICPPHAKVRRIRSRGVIDRAPNGKPIRIVGINWDMGLEAEQPNPVKPLTVARYSGVAAAWAKNG